MFTCNIFKFKHHLVVHTFHTKW